MYSAAIQRYFNEHIHLPYSFFLQPQRFIRHALKKKGAFMATAYNYVEPSEADNEDIIEYLATDFDVMAGNTAGRLCVLMKLPEPTMPLHCKMIGCSIKRDGSNPIWRTIELTEQGTLLLCGWGEGHTHMTICEVGSEPDQFIPRLTQELATATAVWSHVTGTGFLWLDDLDEISQKLNKDGRIGSLLNGIDPFRLESRIRYSGTSKAPMVF